jgi:hypothetical protein
MKFLLMVLPFYLPGMLGAQAAESPSNADILKNMTTDPHPEYSQQPQSAPVLSDRMISLIYAEMNRVDVKNSMVKLNASGSDYHSESLIESLESARAIWALQACLLHPNDDVKISAVRSLGEINDPESVPFITKVLTMNYHLVAGSENATIHDILLNSIGATLKTITGISVRDDGLMPEDHKADTERLEKWCRDKGIGMGK